MGLTNAWYSWTEIHIERNITSHLTTLCVIRRKTAVVNNFNVFSLLRPTRLKPAALVALTTGKSGELSKA